jgi:hypothetical protein
MGFLKSHTNTHTHTHTHTAQKETWLISRGYALDAWRDLGLELLREGCGQFSNGGV